MWSTAKASPTMRAHWLTTSLPLCKSRAPERTNCSHCALLFCLQLIKSCVLGVREGLHIHANISYSESFLYLFNSREKILCANL